MKPLRIVPLILVVMALLSACAGQFTQAAGSTNQAPTTPATPPAAGGFPTQPPVAVSPGPKNPTQVPSPDPGDILISAEAQAAVNNAKVILANQLQIAPAAITVVKVEAVTWSDSCLGVHTGKMCLQVMTPGYRITFEAGSKKYVVQTDASGKSVVLAPEIPQSQIPLIIWQSPDQPCQTAFITMMGISSGACQDTLTLEKFNNTERMSQLASLVEKYQSFNAETKAGKVTFTGSGQVLASPAEQRAVAEWVRMVFMEEQSAGSGAAWGIAFSWSRQGGIAGFCDSLDVYLDGEAVASSCKSDQLSNGGKFTLSSDQLEQLYTWLDQFTPFEITQSDQATADSMTVKMNFNGSGIISPVQSDKQDLFSFASTLFTEAR